MQVLRLHGRALHIGRLQRLHIVGNQRLLGGRQVGQHLIGPEHIVLRLVVLAAGKRLLRGRLVLGDHQLLLGVLQGVPRLGGVLDATGFLELLDGAFPVLALFQLVALLEVVAVSCIHHCRHARLLLGKRAIGKNECVCLVELLRGDRGVSRLHRRLKRVAVLQHVSRHRLAQREERIDPRHDVTEFPRILQVGIAGRVRSQCGAVGVQFAASQINDGGKPAANLLVKLRNRGQVRRQAARLVRLGLGGLQLGIDGQYSRHGLVVGLDSGLAHSDKLRRQCALRFCRVLRSRILGKVGLPAVHIGGPLRAQIFGQLRVGGGDKEQLHPFSDRRRGQRSHAPGADRASLQKGLIGQPGE